MIGLSFGVFAVAAGASVLQACAFSALVFTGASQFAAVGVIASGGSPLAAVASGLLLGLRNAAYGFSVAPILPRSLPARAASSQLIIDESTALALASEKEDAAQAFFAGGMSVFVFWNLGTLIGALVGANLEDPATFGLDAAFPASLLALMGPRLRDRRALTTALVGAAIALATTPFLPAGVPIILAGLAGLAVSFRTGT